MSNYLKNNITLAPKVSVILTSYNHEKFIREAIDSVLNQTFTDFELIIWDDASTDKSWEIIKSYADTRIKAFRNKKNQRGVINSAIKQGVNGEYIAIHHSDDVWEPTKLEKQVKILNKNPKFGAVFSLVQVINEDGSSYEDKNNSYFNVFNKKNRSRHQWLRSFFLRSNSLCHPSVLIRKKCYQDCGLYSLGLGQLPDFEMWVRLLLKYEIYVVQEKLIQFRILNKSKNTSAPSEINSTRILNEYPIVLKNFLKIKSLNDFYLIFPEAKRNKEISKYKNLAHAFALMCIKYKPTKAHAKFGIDLLIELINSGKVDFDHNKIISLNGELDLYNFSKDVHIRDKDAHIRNIESELQRLELSKNELVLSNTGKDVHIGNLENEIFSIKNSLSFKISKPIRFFGRALLKARISLVGFLSAIPILKKFLKLAHVILTLTKHYSLNGSITKILFQLILKPNQTFNEIKKTYNQIISNDSYYKYIHTKNILLQRNKFSIIEEIVNFKLKPKISILMPVYKVNKTFLDHAIKSVLDQLYDNWELCIVDDNSRDKKIAKLLNKYVESNPKIKIKYRKINGHISVATNDAFKISSGNYITFLDHDDCLTPDALYQMVKLLNENDSLKFIYSDEDKIDEKGRRFDPHFKPDWSPHLLLSHNYICHLALVNREIFEDTGGLRKGFEGAQDFDFFLRITSKLNDKYIAHIPEILYHWRAHTHSTAQSLDAKNYVINASVKALESHLDDKGIVATVKVTKFDKFQIKYKLASTPLVSLIIPTRNGYHLLKQAIESITALTDYPKYEIIVVDNGSDQDDTKKYFEHIAKYKNIKVIKDNAPYNYSQLNNRAIKHADGAIIGLINNDIEIISSSWLTEMVSYAVQPDIGAVGAKLLYPNKSLQHGGVITGLGGVAGHSHKHLKYGDQGYFSRAVVVQNVSAVTAACLVMRKDLFLSVGGLNEKQLKIAFNDVDLCLRLRENGYKVIWTPFAELFHHESATRGPEDNPEKVKRFNNEANYMKKKWSGILLNDPYYNKNLTRCREDFSIAIPPSL